MLDRRQFLATAGLAGVAATAFPGMAFAAGGGDRRLLFIIQRGAADGLEIVAPLGDPAYAGLRGGMAENAAGGTKLDSLFTLHPALGELGRLYGQKQALFVHAVASPYRDRSHFDGQNVLETGGVAAYRQKDGWMNRLLGLLPANEGSAIALAPTVPVALRGAMRVASYAPSSLPDAPDDLITRVTDLYAHDNQLAPMWTAAIQAKGLAGDLEPGRNGAATGALAARMMAGASGARIGMVETTGWDTHSAQKGRLATQLKSLDAMIAAYRTGMGDDWARTLVVVATEFGRTARANGTGGTDHGTASAAMLIGGAVAGGRVVTDWPGLANAALYEDRDLKPTLALDAMLAAALAQHFALDPARVRSTVFPGSSDALRNDRLILA